MIDRETFEERAAIREFEGGYLRDRAEELAAEDLGLAWWELAELAEEVPR